MRRFFFLAAALFLFSCGMNNADVELLISGNRVLVNTGIIKKTVIEIACTGSDETKNVSQFVKYFLERFSKYGGGKNFYSGKETLKINFSGDYYKLFFQVGLYLFSNMKNELIKYGLIQKEWIDLINNQEQFSGIPGNEKNNVIRIDDFAKMLTKFEVNKTDKSEIYAYTVQYLLNRVLYVSQQEILARPARYLTFNELDEVFCQVVVLPEITEFTDYILNKFGLSMILKLAENEYTVENWKSIAGEEMSDSESEFAKWTGNKKFNGIFLDRKFSDELNLNLQLYNKMTKPTLFKK